MTKRMLIDATHAEETRVVVLDGNRLEDFDVETSTKKQLKGNIYLAKVVRVEPSLQAAFVEYGGGRHGFLAFGEIHPDYYQIPVADRQRLLAMQAEEARAEEEAADAEAGLAPAPAVPAAMAEPEVLAIEPAPQADETAPPADETAPQADETAPPAVDEAAEAAAEPMADAPEPASETPEAEPPLAEIPIAELPASAATTDEGQPGPTADDEAAPHAQIGTPAADSPPPEDMGGEGDSFEGNGAEEARQRRTARFLRNYRIQEVIRRRQIMLIQVVKEERGTKGAALTTYISLAGRFCVLMPNSPRGGGISRKITSAADRRRLKEITAELDIPQGMGLIVRTAGANRPKPEIRRDCEYLMRLWDDIREHTMASMAPALIYEEASLIKRTIRDVYSRDIDEVYVDGEAGWRAAHDFMRMLMPSHARKVQLWKPREQGGVPLFARYQVDTQLDAMLSPNVQLKSGGYLVINQAEALVAIDVNSGRSTRERGIEETALRTNLEAAEEVARQLRLRDLAGLIVIDFIDMDAKKHNSMVENRLKEALKSDRARIQLGHISHFGLMEMSRQRLRPSLAETSFVTCPHCQGMGLVRSVESSAVHVLRDIEEEGAKERASLIMVHVATPVAMYLLNNKRAALAAIESRYAMAVHFTGDDSLRAPEIRIDRLKPPIPASERAAPVVPVAPQLDLPDEDGDTVADDDVAETVQADAADTATVQPGGDEPQRRRRRRRRRNGRREEGGAGVAAEAAADTDDEHDDEDEPDSAQAGAEADAMTAGDAGADEAAEADDGAEAQPAAGTDESGENGNAAGRKRGRRGGRRRRREHGDDAAPRADATAEPMPAQPDPARAGEPHQIPIRQAAPYTGPTPANPYGGGALLDIFDLMDQAEEAASVRPAATPAPAPAAPAEPEAVETPAAASPLPEASIPEAPIAEVPAPETPAAEAAAPEAPGPEAMAPEAPAPVRARATRAPSARTLAARAAKAARAEAAAQAAAEAAAKAAEAEAPSPAPAEPDEAAPIEPAPIETAPVESAPVESAMAEMAPVAAEPPAPETSSTEPEPATPAIRPLLVGEDVTAGAAPKRGWWRR